MCIYIEYYLLTAAVRRSLKAVPGSFLSEVGEVGRGCESLIRSLITRVECGDVVPEEVLRV